MNSITRVGTVFLTACVSSSTSTVAIAQQFGGEMFSTGAQSRDVLPADVTGDGIVDFVVIGVDRVRTLIGDGAGGYSIGPTSSWNVATFYAEYAQIAHLNSDSELDLVLTISPPGEFVVRHVVMLGLGGGAFQALPGGELGCEEAKLEVADLDHDGDVDVIVASECPLSVCTLMNHGNGVITKFTYPSFGGHSARVADFDGDGELDVALGGFVPGRSVVVHFGTAGVFGAPTKYALTKRSTDVAVGDVDGDGDVDIVAIVGDLSGHRLVTLHNDGTGLFAATYGPFLQCDQLTLADMDGDGALDVVASGKTKKNRCLIARNLGQGTFEPARAWGAAYTFSPPKIFDLDADGHPDVLFGSIDGVVWLRGVGMSTLDAGELEITGQNYRGIGANLDGAGADEIVTVGPTGIRVMHSSGFGRFAVGPTSTMPFVPDYRGADVQLGDVDGDGQLDAVVCDAVGTVAWARGDGLGGFASAVTIDSTLTGVNTSFGEKIAVGDIDGDGIDDIVATNYHFPGTFVWIRSLGNGSFAASSGVPFAGYPKEIRLGDLDHDGRADVFVRDYTFVRVMLAQPGGGFGPMTHYTLPAVAFDMSIGDVNGDTHPDLLIGSGGTGGAIVTLLGDGLGNLGTPIESGAGGAMRLMQVDLDLDGVIDVVGSTGQSFVWLQGDGTGSFTKRGEWACEAASVSAAVTGDFNGDGAVDIVMPSPGFSVHLQLTDGATPGSYCTPKVNSLGCTPRIRTTGTSSALATSGFVVTASDVINDRAGLCFYGFNGTNAGAFQGGTLCVRAPQWRCAPTNSGGNAAPAHDCSGSWSIDFNAFAAGQGSGSPASALSIPGTHVFCQWWGRDGGFAPATNVQLSDAVHYVVLP